MKRAFFTVLLLAAAGACAFAQAVSMDTAIQNAAEEMSGRIVQGTTITVLNFNSPSRNLSSYVMDELSNALVNDAHLTVVIRDSDKLASIRQEIAFNDTDEVSNKDAQQIGKLLGAQVIVNGSMKTVAGGYRMTVQALEVNTGTVRYSKNTDILEDQRLKSLLTNSNVLDFTPAQRAGAAALNLAFGLGSFLVEKDMKGGLITSALEGVGAVAIIYAVAHHASGLNDYNPGFYDSYGNLYGYGGRIRPSITATNDAYPLFIGLVIYFSGAIYGAVRAFTYHKPGYVAMTGPEFPFKIGLASDSRGNAGFRLSYSRTF